MRPTLRNKAMQTREKILESARTIIIEEGLASLSMDHLATVANMSKGAVMYHFKSKRALHIALMEDYANYLENDQLLHEALFEGEPADTLVPGYIEWFKTFEKDNRGWATVGMVLLSAFCNDDEIIAPVREWYQNLYKRIEALPEDRRIRTVMAVMMLEGFFHSNRIGLDLLNPELKEATWRFINRDFIPFEGKRKPESDSRED